MSTSVARMTPSPCSPPLPAYQVLERAFFFSICLMLLPTTILPQTDSRLYAGLHFNSSNTDGLKLGRLVGAKVFDLIQPITAKKSAAATAAPTTQPDKKAAGRRLLAWVARHF